LKKRDKSYPCPKKRSSKKTFNEKSILKQITYFILPEKYEIRENSVKEIFKNKQEISLSLKILSNLLRNS